MARSPSAIVFRCDAGAVAGLGHVSRCLTLAAAFAACGVPVRFVTAEGDGMKGGALASRRGYPVTLAGGPVGTAEDLKALTAALRAQPGAVAVIDSWNATDAYMNAVQSVAITMRIHDTAGTAPPADIVLNPHLDAAYDGPDGGQLRLLGPRYNLIRPAFFAGSAARRGERRVAVTFGGEDPHNHGVWALTELGGVLAGHHIDVIVGPAHPDPQSVSAAATGRSNVRVVIDPPDMAVLLCGASLAITAGGTTCYELAAAGVPQLAVAVEDHQWPLIRAMADAGAMIALGDYHAIDSEAARQQVQHLLHDETARRRLADAGRRLFTEPGAVRVAAAVIDYYGQAARHASRASTAG